MLMLNSVSVPSRRKWIRIRDRTMLMLNTPERGYLIIKKEIRDRTMLMLNGKAFGRFMQTCCIPDRTMLMLNSSKINILFLYYNLPILIFQYILEILPTDRRFCSIVDFTVPFLFRLVLFRQFPYFPVVFLLCFYHVQLYI